MIAHSAVVRKNLGLSTIGQLLPPQVIDGQAKSRIDLQSPIFSHELLDSLTQGRKLRLFVCGTRICQ